MGRSMSLNGLWRSQAQAGFTALAQAWDRIVHSLSTLLGATLSERRAAQLAACFASNSVRRTLAMGSSRSVRFIRFVSHTAPFFVGTTSSR